MNAKAMAVFVACSVIAAWGASVLISASSDEGMLAERVPESIDCIFIDGKGCQLSENIISLKVVSKRDVIDADFYLEGGGISIASAPKGCGIVHKELYECVFEMDPVIEIEKSLTLEARAAFYRKGKDALKVRAGNIRINIVKPKAFDRKDQINALKTHFGKVIELSEESIFDAAACEAMGISGIDSDLSKYASFLGADIEENTISNAISVIASALSLDESFGSFTFQQAENLAYYGHMAGFSLDSIPEDLYTSSPWKRWNVIERIKATCEAFKVSAGDVIDPIFAVHAKKMFYECGNEKGFGKCKSELSSVKEFSENSGIYISPLLKIYVNGALLKDGANICSGSSISLEYENLDIVGAEHIVITGKDGEGCMQIVPLYGEKDVSSFLCGYPDEPLDGGTYEIALPFDDGEIKYNVRYFKDPSKCRIYQESVSVD